jgi:hypothetical protein
MATPTLAPGAWVQINTTNDPARAEKPSAEEQGIGLVRQVFTAEGNKYFQVVWNPGDALPKVGNYLEKQLTVLDQQQAASLRNQMSSSTPTTSGPIY